MSREERERDLKDEIEAHLRMAERDRTERGGAPLEARRAVRREFGNVGLVKEVTRTMWGFQRLEELRKDCAYALRGLRRSPTFAAVAVVTLALGLGANAAIFSLVDGVLLKPPPFPEPDRLVVVSEKPAGGGRNEASGMGFLDWRASSGSVNLAASAGRVYTLTGRGEPKRVLAQAVSAAFFDIFRVRAATGRTFLPQEDQPGKDRVAVISHRTWQTIFGGEPAIIGSTIRLEGNAYTVVGILPPQRFFERHWADVWLPLALTPAGANRDFHYLRVYGRLEPGVTLASAQAELDAIGKRIANDFPATNKGIGILIEQLEARMVDPMLRQTLGVLLCAVGLVLLIACVNLANLLLARSSSRQREIWIRLSIGAGRGRLVRQLLAESLVLAMLGAAVGLGLAQLLLRASQVWMPDGMLPSEVQAQLDWRVLTYLFALALVSSLLFGLAPALTAIRRDVAEGLQEGQRGSTGGRSRRRLRSSLIVAEVALAFILVATAGLMVRSLHRLTNVDTGFRSAGVLTLQFPKAMGQDTDGARLANWVRQILERVSAAPGVRKAAVATAMPLQGWGFGMLFRIRERPTEYESRQNCGFKIVSPSYFKAVGMSLLKGRALDDTDRASSPPVAVVNESMAKAHFAGQEPVGQHVLVQRIVPGKPEVGAEVSWEIVGVVRDEKTDGLEPDAPGMYVPFDQSPVVGFGLVVRGEGDPRALVRPVQTAIWEVDKNQAIADVRMLDDIQADASASPRFRALVLGSFAGIALLLAAVGIYGVVSYAVAQRTRELGIRAALGASPANLAALALRGPLELTALGLAFGAIGSGRIVASLLYRTNPTEVTTLLTVGLVLIVVALAASYAPARRSTRIDPVAALRQE